MIQREDGSQEEKEFPEDSGRYNFVNSSGLRYQADAVSTCTCAGASERLWRWGGHGRGVRGSSPGKKLKPIEANCKHFRAFGAISVYGNYNERLFDSAKKQEDATIGDKHYPPPGKKFKN